MAELLFYKRAEALNRQKHAKLRYTPPVDYSFANKIMAVPLMALEFPLACRQYPIVFTQDGKDNFAPVAVLSLANTGNPFVDSAGQWTAKYIPAFVRRYPFVYANVPEKKDDFAVAFDAESGCFDESKGEPLFDDIGEPAAALKSRMEFLQRFHMESQRTQQLVKTLVEEGLLRPINVDVVRAADQAKFSLRNAMVVDEAKLQKLPGDKAATFIASGLLAVVYAHLISLQNFDAVANRTGGADSTSIPWWRK